MATKKTYNELMDMITEARKFRDDYLIARATRNYNWYENVYFDEYGQPLEYWVNLTHSTIRTLTSSVYYSNPDFSTLIQGGNPGDNDFGGEVLKTLGVNDKFLNYDKFSRCLELGMKIYIKDMKLSRTNKKVVDDTGIAGFGVTKLGYKQALDKNLVDSYELKKAQGSSVNDIEVGEIVKNEQPNAVRIDPRLMLFPDYATTFDNLPWQAQEYYMPIEKARKKYNNNNITASTKINTNATYRNNNAGSLRDHAILYEIHIMDEENPEIYVISEGCEDILMDSEHPLFDKETGNTKNLFKYLQFNDSVDCLYPLSDIDMVAPQISEANLQIARRVKNAKKFASLYHVSGQIMDEELDTINNAEDGDTIVTKDPNAKLNVVERLTNGAEFYENIHSIRQEILDVLGLTDYSVGGATQKRKATEAGLVEAGRRSRVNERLNAIEQFFFEEVDTMIELVKRYQENDKIFKLQYQGEIIPMAFSKRLMELSDMDIQIISGSSVNLSRSEEVAKVKGLIELSQAFAPVADMEAVYKEGLRALGIQGPERFTKKAPSNASVQIPGMGNSVPSPANNATQMPGNVSTQNFNGGGV